MRILQVAGIAAVVGILTIQTIRDIIKETRERSKNGYSS